MITARFRATSTNLERERAPMRARFFLSLFFTQRAIKRLCSTARLRALLLALRLHLCDLYKKAGLKTRVLAFFLKKERKTLCRRLSAGASATEL